MKALLLAAGLGTRLRPLTDTIPKCMLPIDGKPLLAYWLALLADIGITEILINSHYLAEYVEAFINDSLFKKNVTLVYESELLNTGGSVLKNRSFFNDQPFMLIHADNFSVCNYRQFIKVHNQRPENTIATMMTFHTNSPESCGIVELDDEGVVINFYEKMKQAPSNLANGAVYIFEPDIFTYLERENKEKIDLSLDILPQLMGKLYTFHNSQCHIDIGSLKNYQLACDYAEKNILN